LLELHDGSSLESLQRLCPGLRLADQLLDLGHAEGGQVETGQRRYVGVASLHQLSIEH